MTNRHLGNREVLPARRRSETFDVPFGGLTRVHTIAVGYYDDGRVGEVFINAGKSGEMAEAIARDSAILLSLALQFGAPLPVIAKALTRDDRDRPTSIICTVVDRLVADAQAEGA